jgi:maltooligosyltrehalose trehalohydrolase
MSTITQMFQLGANLHGDACEFRVWAPNTSEITLELHGDAHPMRREGEYFVTTAAAHPGDRYAYRVGSSKPVPDPVSRFLPEGVHGCTEILDPNAFAWTDGGWRGLPLHDYIIYELHVGTFTPRGTFDAAIAKLDYLKNTLGVTAVELMPVAAFPGERNWGYDGVSPYAVHAGYGGPEGLKQFIDTAHAIGLAVIIDVVYNHLGNEGNYVGLFGPYFTDRHRTPWGNAINFAERGVREYFLENALYWLREYHADGLRLDAVQTIHDDSPVHILKEIATAAHAIGQEQGRTICVIAESDANDNRLVLDYGIDAFWSDDFHHAVHAILTGERQGYYQDFGDLQQLVIALVQGFAFQGEYFRFWQRQRGTSAANVPLPANVICSQNHDQVGNRAHGERLTQLVKSSAARKATAALLVLAPATPLLFMGQEYDEPSPFLYFTSFADPALVEGVRRGRRQEFQDFHSNSANDTATEPVPDPQDPATFARSKLHWELATSENEMLNWYQELIALRSELVILGDRDCRVALNGSTLTMHVPDLAPRVRVDVNFGGSQLPDPPHGWERKLYAADQQYAVAVYTI